MIRKMRNVMDKVIKAIGQRSATALMIGSVIIPTIFWMSYYNFKLIQDQVVLKEENQMHTIAQAVTDDLESFLTHHSLDLILIGTSRAFQEELKNWEATGIPSFPTLDNYSLLQKDQIDLVGFFSLDGKQIAIAPTLDSKTIYLTPQGLGQIYLGRVSVVGNVYEENGQFYINLLQPVWSGEIKKGFLVTKHNLNNIYRNLIEPVKVGERGYISVKNSRGRILMYPQDALIGKNLLEMARETHPLENLNELEQLAIRQQLKESGAGIYNTFWKGDMDSDAQLQINAFTSVTVGQDFWIVEVFIDFNEATGYLKEHTYTILILYIIMFIIFVSVLIYIYRIKRDKREYQKEASYLKQVASLNEDLESDILKLKLLESELTRSKEKYENIFNAGSDGMFVVDFNEEGKPSRVLEVNNQICISLGYSREELLQLEYSEIIPKETIDFLMKNWSILKERQPIFFETQLKSFTGGNLPVEISVSLMDEGFLIMSARDISARLAQEEALSRSELRFRAIVNQVANGVTASIDADVYGDATSKQQEKATTDRKNRTVVELERINIRLEEMFKKELDEKKRNEALMIYQSRLAAMGEMIGSIAHQWRQPISAISMIFNNIEDAYEFKELDGKFLKDQGRRLQDLVKYMSQTIDDFRFFFNPKIDKEKFLMSSILDQTLDFLRESIRLNNIVIDIEMGKDILLDGRPNQLSQVLFSILKNAIDAIVNNERDIRKIVLRCFENEGKSILQIEDYGGGVPEDKLNRIFEMYYTTKAAQNGTGLGLYISKVIIEKNFYGEISAANGENGLNINIEIPI